MEASPALAVARIAGAESRWRDACDGYAQARAELSGTLPAVDAEVFATALFLRGRPAEAFETLTAAHEAQLSAGDTLGAARTAGWLAIELLEAGEVSAAATWVARGNRLVMRLPEHEQVGGLVSLVPAAFTVMFVGDETDALRRYDDIDAFAAAAGDAELACHAAFGRGKTLTMVGRTTEGMASLDRAMSAIADGDASPVTTCLINRVVLDVFHEAFDLQRAERWTEVFGHWCDRQPQLVSYTGQAAAYRAQLAMLRGRWAAASAHAATAREQWRAGDFTAAFVAHYQLGELERLRGDFRAAESHYARAAETGWDPQPGLALLRLARGDVLGAQAMIRSSAAGALEGARRRLLPALVHIDVAAGSVPDARVAVDELSRFVQAAPTPMLVAAADFAAAEVLAAEGAVAAALARAESARAAWSELDAPYEAGRCRMLVAQLLLRLERPDDAAEAAAAAAAVFEELGARADLKVAAALSGGHPDAALTDREVEVLRLVTTGLTNRGIAGRLSISEKTVARHLANIFAKLGLSSRAAATAYAYQNSLV
jgi:DNA-binding NarL/FixJ family response regulator